jgi:hypothetical protein
MLIMWRIRRFDRNTKSFGDRDLVLDTSTLDANTRIEVEVAAETRRASNERSILKYLPLFHEEDWRALDCSKADKVSSFSLTDYFEDETGSEISIEDIARIITGSPDAIVSSVPLEPHDVALRQATVPPVPVTSVTISQEELNLLGYSARDLAELMRSALMIDGPGTMSSGGRLPPNAISVETAASDEEIRSFVTIFRRLYMETEPANFIKAADIYAKALHGHPFADWMLGVKESYQRKLQEVPDFMPFIQPGQISFTRKLLLDVFIYTQYAHQPSPKREREFNECLAQINGRKSLLLWLFLRKFGGAR